MLTLQYNDTAVLGDALIAAKAINLFPTLEEGVQAMVATAERVDPIPENVSLYEKAYRHYCQLNDTLEPLFRQHFKSTDAE